MPMTNREIAERFERLADLYEIEGADPFRIRAYRNAAREIAHLGRSVADMVARGEDLSRLPGIGKAIAQKIQTLVRTGELPQLVEAERRVPRTLSDLMRIPGLGPKRVRALYQTLGVRTVEDLERALRRGQVRLLPGFAAKTEQRIAEGLHRLQREERRLRRDHAEAIAEPLVAWLRATPGVRTVEVAGSYRRRRETVGDLDILAVCRRGAPIMERLRDYEDVAEVQAMGTTRATVILRSGVQVDLRVVPQVSYGAALMYFTGSKAHNVELRTLAVQRGEKLNEYGLFRGERRVAGRSEAEVYRHLGLELIPPELREARGEIDAARERRLPRLLEREDLRGDLHCHTRETDGHDTLEAMAEAARRIGHEYLAITDHSRHVTIANGMDAERLLAQCRAIDALNERLDGIRLLKGVEVDILEDGSLDLPDDVLAALDIRVCAIHYKFDLPAKAQTERLLRAMDHPLADIVAHPSGRLINERPPMALDLERVIRAAAERGVWLELNAQPSRLDLTDDACLLAREYGAKVVISSDAHSAEGLAIIRYGVDQARRGWLEPADVVNTRPVDELLAMRRSAGASAPSRRRRRA